jgi:predicted dehydrogenase
MGRTRVAVVSATGTGRKRILPALRDSSTCLVTAVHGRDAARIEELREDFGVAHAYTDLQRMVAEREFDIAVVCSPPCMHAEQLKAFIAAGIPTLCEKPLALTAGEAAEIGQLAAQSGTLVGVAHHLRHQSTYAEIRAVIASGEIGEVMSAFMEWSFEMNRAAPSARWKQDPTLNGLSSLSDVGVHCLDIAVGLFGPATVVGASSPGRDAGGVFEACDVLALHGTVQVATRVSRLYGPYSNQLLISGTRGEIRAPRFFTEASAPLVRVTGTHGERAIEQTLGNAYRREVEDFARAVCDTGHIFAGTTLDEAVTTCHMLDQAHALLQAGG